MTPLNSIRKISQSGFRSPKYVELGHSTLLFCRRWLKYTNILNTRTELLFYSFNLFLVTFRWRRRRDLLKLPTERCEVTG